MTTITVPETAVAHRSLIVNKKGTQTGYILSFIGKRSAKEIRAVLAKKGLKGSDLTAKVNDVLRGRSTFSEQCAHAAIVEASREAEKRGGTIAWESMRWNNTSIAIKAKYVKPTKVATPAATTAKPAPSIDEAIDSMTEEQAMAFVAKLSAKFGA